jgi:hypothetical protein
VSETVIGSMTRIDDQLDCWNETDETRGKWLCAVHA